METVIHIENLSKEYVMDNKFKQNIREAGDFGGTKAKKIVALSDINLTICKGDVVGIIGDNGSGKSTLLKVISGITKPTKGKLKIAGKVASILEVGTGFHPELSGRENIKFSAKVLGMETEDLVKATDEIIQFSELEDFMEMQVKYYSSGMFMRLAFAVVAHLKAEIILLDEVFSVGDAAFKRKCEKRIKELASSDTTILLVSHEINSISSICNQFLWLKNGKKQLYSNDLDVINKYLTQHNQEDAVNTESDSPKIRKEKNNLFQVELKNENSNSMIISSFENDSIKSPIEFEILSESPITTSSEILLKLRYDKITTEKIHPVIILSYNLASFSIALNSKYNEAESQFDDVISRMGEVECTCSLPKNILNNGLFGVTIYFLNEHQQEILFLPNISNLSIAYETEFKEKYIDDGKISCPVKPRLKWQLENI